MPDYSEILFKVSFLLDFTTKLELIFIYTDLGLEGCIEHVWRDTIVYLDNDDPIMIGRAYGRVSRQRLHEELLKR